MPADRVLLVVAGLFVVVATLHVQGSAVLLPAAVGDGSDAARCCAWRASVSSPRTPSATCSPSPSPAATPPVAALLVVTGAGPLLTPGVARDGPAVAAGIVSVLVTA